MSNLYTHTQIRQVFSADAAQLAKIHQNCFPSGWSEQEFFNLLNAENNFCYAMEINNKIVGFILCSQIFDECEILTLAVEPEFRRQKIAKILIEHIFYHAKQKHGEKIFLEVAEDNDAAQTLYKNAGFIEIARRKNYYLIDNKPIDALVMQYVI